MIRMPTNALQVNPQGEFHDMLPTEKMFLLCNFPDIFDRMEVNRILSLQRVRFLQSLEHSLRPLNLLLHRKAWEENIPHLH